MSRAMSNSTSNPFEVLGLTPQFSLAKGTLLHSYLSLQKKFHPDFGVGAHDDAAAINAAFQALKNPLSRLKVLMTLEGVEEMQASPELLMEVMEWRQVIDESPTKDDLSTLQKIIKEDYEKCTPYFLDKNWDAIKQVFVKLQYLEKIASELKDKLL